MNMKTNMRVNIPKDGYHFPDTGIIKIEEHYKAKYLGYWTIKTRSGGWSEWPVDVFYQPNPDTAKGHTHYFGMYRPVWHEDNTVMITNAESAFSEPMVGLVSDDGEVLVSHYRHDCVTKDNLMIDGGRDYTRRSMAGKTVIVTVVDGKFVFEEPKYDDKTPNS